MSVPINQARQYAASREVHLPVSCVAIEGRQRRARPNPPDALALADDRTILDWLVESSVDHASINCNTFMCHPDLTRHSRPPVAGPVAWPYSWSTALINMGERSSAIECEHRDRRNTLAWGMCSAICNVTLGGITVS